MKTEDYRREGFRRREFHYDWCNKTEVDYVCTVCGTIVVNVYDGCQRCRKIVAQKREQLDSFLAERRGDET